MGNTIGASSSCGCIAVLGLRREASSGRWRCPIFASLFVDVNRLFCNVVKNDFIPTVWCHIKDIFEMTILLIFFPF